MAKLSRSAFLSTVCLSGCLTFEDDPDPGLDRDDPEAFAASEDEGIEQVSIDPRLLTVDPTIPEVPRTGEWVELDPGQLEICEDAWCREVLGADAFTAEIDPQEGTLACGSGTNAPGTQSGSGSGTGATAQIAANNAQSSCTANAGGVYVNDIPTCAPCPSPKKGCNFGSAAAPSGGWTHQLGSCTMTQPGPLTEYTCTDTCMRPWTVAFSCSACTCPYVLASPASIDDFASENSGVGAGAGSGSGSCSCSGLTCGI
ncbi:MAG: hypothetical protein K1X88_24145 [Nannocystaceae bacterium]|nr:hypothetical protein [Nannocystaceae bacterium]